ncbi:trypsin-like serine peptidase [Smaragdicoccus niigatensis]|uniref:trypsin-like serine peptidase n=1 Tax=Smaragdicoccus niigatensis TaxID=359359 RepID=UPI00037957C4|nr:serine protease [Smaragdicoccus niigatensis]
MTIDDFTMSRGDQVDAATRRYAQSESQRAATEVRRNKAGHTVVDTHDQIVARATRLLKNGEIPAQAVIDVGREELDADAALERIIGAANESQPVSFLPRGTRAASAVARISLSANGGETPQGTGSLVSPRLLLTNNHVLPDVVTAGTAVIEFGAEIGVDNAPAACTRFRLDPDTFFVTDKHLDYTLVLVAPRDDGTTAGQVVGWFNPLIAQTGKIVIGEAMNIIGHPMGRFKEISIRDNRLEAQLDEFLHYTADTLPGNSGSPVFNDQWEVVALHHAGVKKKDDQGRVLRKDGKVWQPGDGEDAIEWAANEGARVSVILKNLADRNLTPTQQDILAELGRQARVAATPAAAPAPATEPQPATEKVPAPILSGVSARPGAFGGKRSMVFIHGRSQQGHDPELLRRAWTAGLNKGLTLAGVSTVEPADIYFPFYGDRLVEDLGAKESITDDLGSGGLFAQMIAEAAENAGMPPDGEVEAPESLGSFGSGVVSKIRTQLAWLAARSGLDDAIIETIFKDVAAYLDNEETRENVLDTVAADLPSSGPIVLVSHSLGTVVAMDLLTRLSSNVEVTLMVTAGSPLGLDAVYKKLLIHGPTRPSRVGKWLNTWYAGDPIAIGCPLRKSWGPNLLEMNVENPKAHAHDIAEYLAHPEVAETIHEGLIK